MYRVVSVPACASALVARSTSPVRVSVALLLDKLAGVTALVASVPVCVSLFVASSTLPFVVVEASGVTVSCVVSVNVAPLLLVTVIVVPLIATLVMSVGLPMSSCSHLLAVNALSLFAVMQRYTLFDRVTMSPTAYEVPLAHAPLKMVVSTGMFGRPVRSPYAPLKLEVPAPIAVRAVDFSVLVRSFGGLLNALSPMSLSLIKPVTSRDHCAFAPNLTLLTDMFLFPPPDSA